MSITTSYLSFPLLERTNKSHSNKDLLNIPIYIVFAVGPIVMAEIFPIAFDFFFLILLGSLGIYYFITLGLNQNLVPYNGRIHFTSEGIHIEAENELFLPYDEILKINIHYQGYTPQMNFLPYQITANMGLFNKLEIIHRNQILSYYFYSSKREDENKLNIVMRKIIPKEIDCLLEVKDYVELKRVNGGLVREKRSSLLKLTWNSLKNNLDIYSYIQLTIFIIFILGIFYHYRMNGELFLGVFLSLFSIVAVTLIHSSRN